MNEFAIKVRLECYIKQLVELLSAQVTYSTIVDSKGNSQKKITIIYKDYE